MDPTRAEIAESFSRHDFARAYAHLSEDVRWEVVGDRRIEGRDDVVAACEASASYLDGVTTRFLSFRTMVGPDFVVTDSRAEYVDADGETSVVASCDIYRFTDDGLLTELTSYTVELGA
jgi:SnoaL-like domain